MPPKPTVLQIMGRSEAMAIVQIENNRRSTALGAIIIDRVDMTWLNCNANANANDSSPGDTTSTTLSTTTST